jgi:hypothetical protein
VEVVALKCVAKSLIQSYPLLLFIYSRLSQIPDHFTEAGSVHTTSRSWASELPTLQPWPLDELMLLLDLASH